VTKHLAGPKVLEEVPFVLLDDCHGCLPAFAFGYKNAR
jgi:hypothetical protein